jgi:hypothetical protein
MKREWPADWTESVRCNACPMCAEGRPEVAHGSSRIAEGSVSDAYLHSHVVPRYLDDGEPGHPPHFMRADFDLKNAPQVAEQAYARDLAALRELLRR